MKNIIKHLIRSAAIAAFITGTATLALGAEIAGGANGTGTPAAANATVRAYPFRGTVGTADPAAKTVSLAGRTSTRIVHLDQSSKLLRDGKEIALSEVQTGDYLRGTLQKSDGHETLVKASIGERPEPKPRANRSGKGRSTAKANPEDDKNN